MGPELLSTSLNENLMNLRAQTQHSTDVMDHRIQANGVDCVLLFCDGMVSQQLLAELMAEPLLNLRLAKPGAQPLLQWLNEHSILAAEQKAVNTMDDLLTLIMSGFVVILADGASHGIACGLQGYPTRSVSEPDTEMNLRGAREGFVESVRVNQTMIRRRIKSPALKFELYPLGNRSKTDISLVYLTDRADPRMVEQVKEQLSKVESDVVLSTGYLQPFLEGKPLSLFPRVGSTERPDVMCAKIAEGRIGILVDGTPFAMIVPYLFNEHFQSLDDYAYRPYYAMLLRLLKYVAFFISILLPGMYVALSVFDPEFLPDQLLFTVVSAEEATPFPLMLEALIIHLIYEIMREAGLRLPKQVGHAVSIVGALVIGDAAVNAGLIGSPMVMIVALTAISSFVLPSLYEAVAVLKFIFILIGGTWGLYGIALGLLALAVNLCAMMTEGVPLMAPLAPFSKFSMRDTVYRQGWRKLGKKQAEMAKMPGSDWENPDPEQNGGKNEP